MVHLTESSERDLHRIYGNNLEHFGCHDQAISRESGIIDAAGNLTANSGRIFKGRRAIENEDGYLLFFEAEGEKCVVYAIFHKNEDWWHRVEPRLAR